jgi:hypothetical protein
MRMKKSKTSGEVRTTDKASSENHQKEVEGVYDSGVNASFINQKIIDQIKADITQDKSMFKSISGKDFTSGRVKLRMKIDKIERR